MKAHLLPELRSISEARSLVSDALEQFPEEFRAEAVLVTSELVTNAVVHARTPVVLDLTVNERWVVIAVEDDSSAEPDMRPNSPDAANGRGLNIVDALSRSCGVKWHKDHGKSVWAKLSTFTATN